MDFSFEGLILKPLLMWCMIGLFNVYNWLFQVTTEFFSLEIIKVILEFFQWAMFGMFVLGVLFALIDYAVDFVDGNNPNAFTLFKNLGKGFLVAMFSQKIVLLIFQIARIITLALFKLDAIKILEGDKVVSSFGINPGSMVLMSICIIVFMIVLVVSITFQYLERNGILLIHIGMSIFYIISICRGYQDPFSGWVKQGIAICFTQTMQTLCLVLAFAMFTQSNYFFIGVGLLLAASKVDKAMQQFAFSSGSRGSAKNAVNGAITAFRLMTIKK